VCALGVWRELYRLISRNKKETGSRQLHNPGLKIEVGKGESKSQIHDRNALG